MLRPVRKTQKPGKAARVFLLALVMTLLGLGVYAVVRFLSPPSKPLNSQERQVNVNIIDRAEEDLLRFTVMSSKGDVFTILRVDGSFQVEGQPDFPLDAQELRLIVQDLTVLHANEEAGRVRLDEESLSLLGLGKAAPRVSAWYADGSTVTLIFGNSSMEEIPADYLMVAGDDMVYTVSPETKDHFDRTLATLHPVPAINFNSSLLDAVSFEGGGALRLSQQEGLWEIKAPFFYPAQTKAISSLLKSVDNMRFALYHGEATGEVLKATGLETPARTIVFELAQSVITTYDRDGMPRESLPVSAQSFRIAIGDDIGNIGLYCLYDGKVYQASNVSMGFLRDTKLEDLLSDAPISLPVNRLSALTIHDSGKVRRYTIEMVEQITANNQLGRDDLGNLIYEPHIQRDGMEIEREAFLREYLRLMDLRGSGLLKAGFVAPPEASAVRRYVLEGLDGLTRELALFPYDALHYAMRVNGTFVDYISRAQADLPDL